MTAQNQTTPQTGSKSCNTMDGGGRVQRRKGGGRNTRQARSDMEALTAAITQQSSMNYQVIFDGFTAMGIAGDDIAPRENVFTFAAWKALGRVVRKGEHGVRVCVFVSREKTDKETGAVSTSRMPAHTTVFHVSQTDPLPEAVKAAAAETTTA